MEAYEFDLAMRSRSKGLMLPMRHPSAKIIPFVKKEAEPAPARSDVKIHDFEEKMCSPDEWETIKAYMRIKKPDARFREDRERLARQITHNLKRGVSVEFLVGGGTTLRSNLRTDLVAAGLMSWEKSFYADGQQGKSWITPTKLFTEISIRPCQLLVKEKKVKGKVIKEHIPYFPNDGTLEALAEFNEFMAGFDVASCHDSLNETFRMNYVPQDDGSPLRARLIHPLHSIDKDLRCTVTIDGVECNRRDVKACHPQLILSMDHNLPMTYSPYDIAPDGFKYKEDLVGAAKWMLQMMLNNKNEASARSAFSSNDEIKRKHRVAAKIFSKSLTGLMRAIEKNNPLLSGYFYKARHAELMNVEGSIMFMFHRKLMRQGIPSLSVHDEYLVKPEHRQIADRVYAECWQEITGAANIFPVVEDA
ncbi:hypothetical protein [Tichowtungia aerotolerans]|uniref:Uncharacterized protein n=1 Tax=Tichowtungia aerotolerans TaxID=2697043 RepID=A0A6P1M1X9_9BACT|nr:hypothetical protein [Tichowtungia aerotolerans]QHI68590.1 hypothetical protein GT409_03705 [Tichowtungia aerotolerans]